MNDVEILVKQLLFARWLSACYADTHVDENLHAEYQEGFDDTNGRFHLLQMVDGLWFVRKLNYFNKTVWPIYIENGRVAKYMKIFKNKK